MVSDDERHSASILDDPKSDAADSEFRDKHYLQQVVIDILVRRIHLVCNDHFYSAHRF